MHTYQSTFISTASILSITTHFGYNGFFFSIHCCRCYFLFSSISLILDVAFFLSFFSTLYGISNGMYWNYCQFTSFLLQKQLNQRMYTPFIILHFTFGNVLVPGIVIVLHPPIPKRNKKQQHRQTNCTWIWISLICTQHIGVEIVLYEITI